MYTVNVNRKEGIKADLRASNKEAVRTETPSADDNTTSSSESQDKTHKSRKMAERDKEYNAAVKSGDMKSAQRMVKAAARASGYTNNPDWRMDHKASNADDDTAHDMSFTFDTKSRVYRLWRGH